MGQTLEIEGRELSPELLADYLKFFDRAFSDFPHWAGCYCGFYDTPGNDWDPTAKAGPEHRAARAERISSGKAQGLLAYVEGDLWAGVTLSLEPGLQLCAPTRRRSRTRKSRWVL